MSKESQKADSSLIDDLERIGKLTPLISLFIVSLGFFDLSDYYYRFGIIIWKYLAPSDVLLYFANYLVVTLESVVIIVVIAALLFFIRKKLTERRYSKFLTSVISLGVGFAALVAINYGFDIIDLGGWSDSEIVGMVEFVILPFSIIFFFTEEYAVEKYGKPAFFYGCILLFYFLFGIHRTIENKKDFAKLKNHEWSLGVALTLKEASKSLNDYPMVVNSTNSSDTIPNLSIRLDKVLKTNDGLIYFGSTSNYFFFRVFQSYKSGSKTKWEMTSNTLIIPQSNVLEIYFTGPCSNCKKP